MRVSSAKDQLVFGRNPCVENNELPAMEGQKSSEIVANNLNAMHSARKNYIELESSEKLRRALRANVRNYSDQTFGLYDIVYYK